MYLSSRSVPDAGLPSTDRGKIPPVVFALGTVSLLTDISAEMITAFLPIYLLYTLQLGYVQFGLLDGLYNGATALLRLIGGYVADKLQRPKLVAFVGYATSTVTKLIFPAAGASGLGIGGVLAADRAGKGLRTAPRDALITQATKPERLGRAFGVHRSMDTVGALIGPLVTFWILRDLGNESTPVFMVSFLFGLIGLIVLVTFVREPKKTAPVPGSAPVSLKACVRLLKDRQVRRMTLAAAALGLVTLSDAFVFVVLQKSTGVPFDYLPLMPMGTALVFLSAAVPMGWLADRFGRWQVFYAGHVLLLGVYVVLVTGGGGVVMLVAALLLHGCFYAATDGVLMAYAGPLVPPELRASGLAVVQTGQAVARLISSVLFGVMLTVLTMKSALWLVFGAFLLALAVAAMLLGRKVTS
ncbi:MFS-type transporter involved in bile tolerance, Atg22 family [Amycolatopsis xylanica]|uniref:MFS-type transporter involved in bile tolerance, Atg22 family n=1 Tax=Amycolatopsis xylanica TaxID=589385 RepID=A0A1H3L8Q4_9PSEU|nr:MFS transporter [Amycolatopsis xylanica]SDY60823.1 MFS-type transporter involved in bile tolerance, Atg22 family [Amycolatopsis xylanica]